RCAHRAARHFRRGRCARGRHGDVPWRAERLCGEYQEAAGRMSSRPLPMPQPDPPEEDGVERGKRLIRLSDDRGQSLTQRMANHFYRMTWATPFHTMRLKGKYPLKLLAVPDDGIPGDARAGKALRAGY